MGRPVRRYCFLLAERLSMTVEKLLDSVSSKELSEWMAFDLTRDEDWSKKFYKQKELEASRAMSEEQRLEAFKRLFQGK